MYRTAPGSISKPLIGLADKLVPLLPFFELHAFVHLVVFETRGWSKEADDFHFVITVVSDHVGFSLLKQHGGAGTDGTDFTVNPDLATAGHDVDELFTDRMCMSGLDGLAGQYSDHTTGQVFWLESLVISDPSNEPPGNLLLFNVGLVNDLHSPLSSLSDEVINTLSIIDKRVYHADFETVNKNRPAKNKTDREAGPASSLPSVLLPVLHEDAFFSRHLGGNWL